MDERLRAGVSRQRPVGHRVELVGSFVALLVAVFGMRYAVDNAAFAQRGRTTSCTVVRVDKQQKTSTDANGHLETTDYYDTIVDCAAPQVRDIRTINAPAGKPGSTSTWSTTRWGG